MKIVVAGLSFPDIGRTLGTLLPDDEVRHCPLEALRGEIPGADVLIPAMTRIDAGLIQGSGLKLIQQWGVGLEGVDMAASTAAGIPVCNVPAEAAPANAVSTAEHALFLMMAASRRLHLAQTALKQGPWGSPIGRALSGCRALIVGLGRVGGNLARMLLALNMTVDAIKARPDRSAADPGLNCLAGPDELKGMLPDADYVVSTVTAGPRTIKLFNHELFSLVKPGMIFVNVSRGQVVDEDALLKALESERVAGAGLDVFFSEPPVPSHPLLNHERVVAMPHLGGITRQCYHELARAVMENVERIREGMAPLHQANA